MDDQTCHLMRWRPVIIRRWGHNFSRTIDDSHPDLDDRFNKKLEFESRRPDGLINWVGKQTKILSCSVINMAE